MLSASEFRELASGRTRGWRATLLRTLLRLIETPYAWAMRLRNRAYDGGQGIVHVAVPVISVGNLTLGGTGKTPLVAWIARWLRAHDVRVTLISRGYGAEAASPNDEALELEQQLPDVPHLQNADRIAAAQVAIDEFDCQIIVLDDGFQHRRLARDFDVVLLDASEPFGLGHVFPRGLLREPISGLRRADCVVLSRADMIDADARLAIRGHVARFAPHATWVEACHAPDAWLSASSERRPLDMLAGQRVAAFCGLGNPLGFRHSLETCGLIVAGFREFPDHHPYERTDVESLIAWAAELGVAALVCTHKDLVKLDTDRLGPTPLWALGVRLDFLAGQADLEAELTALLPLSEAEARADS